MKCLQKKVCRIGLAMVKILLKAGVIVATLAGSYLVMAAPSLVVEEVKADLIQRIDTSHFPAPDIAGIVYLPAQDAFLISDSEINEMAIFQGKNVFKVDRHGALLETFSTLAFSDEPTGVTINPLNNHCFFSDDTGNRSIYEVDPGDDGICLTADDKVTSFVTKHNFGSADPEDVAYALGSLFIVDGLNNRVYRISPGENLIFDNVLTGDDLVSSFDTQSMGVTNPRGIAFDATNDSLYIVGTPRDLIIESSIDGVLLRTIDISSIHPNKPAGLALAPRSDNFAMTSLYMVSQGEDNDSNPTENDGMIYELGLPERTAENKDPGTIIDAILQSRVTASADDAEERIDGSMYINSSDLELVVDSKEQTVGLRFTDLTIPSNALINKAYIQFKVDEQSTNTAQLSIYGESTGNAPYFDNSKYNISERSSTNANVTWSPLTWNIVGSAAKDQRSADLSSIIQEIVSETAWQSGNAMAFIFTGTGKRVAEAYDGDPTESPLLYVQYSYYVDEVPPTIELTSPIDGAVVSGIINLQVEALDNSGIASVQYRWDSRDIGSAITEAPFTLMWNSAEIGDGFFTLSAVATDLDGNTAISNVVVIQIKNTVSDPIATTPPTLPGTGDTLNVPSQYATIQAAVDAAKAGDVVLIAPGTYTGGIKVSSQAITIASRFLLSADEGDVTSTRIKGGAPVILIDGSAGNTKIIGLTIADGTKGVQCFVFCEVLNNFFANFDSDAMSLERAGGNIIANEFIDSGDDAIDLDGPGETLISDNNIKASKDDGIEIRNFDDAGAVINVVIRNNSIAESGEDGLQLIDYPAKSSRVFTFENNLITNSDDAGIGLMAGGVTVENLSAASVPERIYVFNNTIVGNKVGLSGGDNLVAVNNIFVNSSSYALKGVNGNSIAAYNLYYNSGGNIYDSNISKATMINADPKFGRDYELLLGSPAIDSATKEFIFEGETVLTISVFLGENPDLGSVESK